MASGSDDFDPNDFLANLNLSTIDLNGMLDNPYVGSDGSGRGRGSRPGSRRGSNRSGTGSESGGRRNRSTPPVIPIGGGQIAQSGRTPTAIGSLAAVHPSVTPPLSSFPSTSIGGGANRTPIQRPTQGKRMHGIPPAPNGPGRGGRGKGAKRPRRGRGGKGGGSSRDSSSSSSDDDSNQRRRRGRNRGGRNAIPTDQAGLRHVVSDIAAREGNGRRRIAGVTHTSTITTTYKDGRRPRVNRTSHSQRS